MLEIRDISKSFGGRPVLREVSFSVKKGQIYGLIGKNGAGKTTLLTIVAGLAKADSGECQVDHKRIHGFSVDEPKEQGGL